MCPFILYVQIAAADIPIAARRLLQQSLRADPREAPRRIGDRRGAKVPGTSELDHYMPPPAPPGFPFLTCDFGSIFFSF